MNSRKRKSPAKHCEPHLRVYHDRSVLIFEDGSKVVFKEGRPSDAARKRYERISDALSKGWLDRLYSELPAAMETVSLTEEIAALLTQIVEAVTSEVGRAVVGLTILQLTIKCIEPSQNVRLHKGGTGDFSWCEGISMRRLDSQFITPFLRKHSLLRINKDGLFMTRSLAENYPYTQFYKASVRGAKQAWLNLIDLVEAGAVESCIALKYLLAKLRNRAEYFNNRAENALQITQQWLKTSPSTDHIQQLILQHIDASSYSARLLEIGMHAFLQVLEDRQLLSGRLAPLCQMRTANKKHRNVADIEIVNEEGAILDAWDAKYGKPYLLDELYELEEKLEVKTPEVVGFVVNRDPDIRQDIRQVMLSIQEAFGVEIHILALPNWLALQRARVGIDAERDIITKEWAMAYVETLCQRRRDRAPIDEPADQWVEDWIKLIEEAIS